MVASLLRLSHIHTPTVCSPALPRLGFTVPPLAGGRACAPALMPSLRASSPTPQNSATVPLNRGVEPAFPSAAVGKGLGQSSHPSGLAHCTAQAKSRNLSPECPPVMDRISAPFMALGQLSRLLQVASGKAGASISPLPTPPLCRRMMGPSLLHSRPLGHLAPSTKATSTLLPR